MKKNTIKVFLLSVFIGLLLFAVTILILVFKDTNYITGKKALMMGFLEWKSENITKNDTCSELVIGDTKILNDSFASISYSGGIDYWCNLKIIDFFQYKTDEQNQSNGILGIRETIIIPKEIGKLNNLYKLSLHNVEIEGEIPNEIGELGKLITLKIHGANIGGEIPKELGNLKSLRILDLSNNNLKGEIPVELGGLANIIEINLSNNNLSGALKALVDLKKISELNLTNNKAD